MAGTKPYTLETGFDPREMTLGEFIDFYAKESSEKGGRSNTDWPNKIRNNPVYKDFLKEPVIEVLDSTATIGEDSIYQAAENAEGTDSGKATLQSRMRVLEDNVLKRVELIQAQEGVDLSKYISLTKATPRRATRGKQATLKTQFDSNKMGQLVKNLEDHVKKFPEDRPKANSILLLLELGSRPSLPLEIISTDYVTSRVPEEAELLGSGVRNDGLHIPAERKGVKRQAGGQTPNVQPYNSPLSQRAITILQDQSEYNRTNFGENRLDFFFQIKDKDGQLRPLDLGKDINPLLKSVTPPGTVQKLKGGKFVATDEPLTAKNFRTIWSNIAFNALDDAKKVSYLQSRDIGANTGSVSVYLGQVGDYKPAAINDLNEISRKTWGLYSLMDAEGKQQFKKSGNLLSTSTMLFGDNLYSRKERMYEPFGSGTAQSTPIQTGGFSAPVDKSVSQAPMPAPAAPVESAAPSSYADFTEADKDAMTKAGFKIDWSKLSVGALTGAGVLSVLSNPAQAAVDVGLEVGARALGAAAGPAAAVPMIMSPTELGDATRQEGDGGPATQEELDMSRLQAAQGVKERDAARVQESAIPSQYPDADNFLTMQP